MTKRTKREYRIRCKNCGYETTNFPGWTFVNRCDKPNEPSMLHNWEKVE